MRGAAYAPHMRPGVDGFDGGWGFNGGGYNGGSYGKEPAASGFADSISVLQRQKIAENAMYPNNPSGPISRRPSLGNLVGGAPNAGANAHVNKDQVLRMNLLRHSGSQMISNTRGRANSML